MKRIVLALLVVVLFCSVAEASQVYVTSNTISFNTIGRVVTFNTTVNKILVINETTNANLNVQFDGSRIGWNTDSTLYTLPILSNTTRILPSSSISLDVSTDKIGIIGKASGTVTYVATSERRVAND